MLEKYGLTLLPVGTSVSFNPEVVVLSFLAL
jgi:hypothetical protein